VKLCPTCNRQYEGDDYVKCPYDGTNLVDAEAASADPRVGAHFGDSYTIVRVIGEGGMGRVYEARHVRLSKRYAIKLLHPQFNANPETIARFRREAEAASSIGQENILDVVDFNQNAEGVYYIVTEYLEGRSLDRALCEDGIPRIPRALGILHQIARALTAAHEHGIVHRDLKPENIFLVRRFDTDDFVKVLDFGISKVRTGGDRLTQTGQIIGTPHYMSPEQAQGELNLDHRSDVYSFGAIMYEMFTGDLPYQADSVQQLLVKVLTEEPPPPRARRAELSADIEAVIQRCMMRDPEQRYQTMVEVDRALMALWASHVGAEAPTPMERFGLSSSPTHAPATGGVGIAPGPGSGGTDRGPGGEGTAPTAYSEGGRATGADPGTPPSLSAGTSSPQATGSAEGWGPAVRATPSPVGQSVTGPGLGARRRSALPLILLVMLLAGGGGAAALWWFVLRDASGGDREGRVAKANPDPARPARRAAPASRRPKRRAAPSRRRGAAPRRARASGAQPAMVRFAAGTFTQGRKGGHKYESPPKKGVKVAAFWLDATEVSRRRYTAYLARQGSAARSPWGESRTPPPGTEDLPVTDVTWKEAGAFCADQGKRLPTEAEWEYAARGPTHDKLYPWGDRFDPNRVVSSVAKPTKLQPVRSGVPVGGVYHLVGNAWEWVSTRYQPYPGSRAGRAYGTQYVIRGGGADTRKPQRLTATWRVFNYGHRNPKTKKLAVYRYLGFRCARGPSETGRP